MTGSFFERQPAIGVWKQQDPSVELINVDVPGAVTERFHVARKVTDLGRGLWHYEYAVHNLNSDRGARAFEVELTTPDTVGASLRPSIVMVAVCATVPPFPSTTL